MYGGFVLYYVTCFNPQTIGQRAITCYLCHLLMFFGWGGWGQGALGLWGGTFGFVQSSIQVHVLTKFVKPCWDYEEIVFCGLNTLIFFPLHPITLTLLYMNKKLWLQIPPIRQKIRQIFFLWHVFKEAKLSLYEHILVIAGLLFSQTA